MSEKPIIDIDHEHILSLPIETQVAPNGIVSHTLMKTATARVVLFGFAEGQQLSEHTSTQEALVQILSSECEFSLAGETAPTQSQGSALHAAESAARSESNSAVLDATDLVQTGSGAGTATCFQVLVNRLAMG